MKEILIGAFSMLAFSGWCGRTNDSDSLPVTFSKASNPTSKPISAEERAHIKFLDSVYAKLPHIHPLYTLGRLVAMCDTVAIVRVAKVDEGEILDYAPCGWVTVTYSVERLVFGAPRKKKEVVRFYWIDKYGRALPHKGDRWLAFIADDDEALNYMIAGNWGFNKEDHPVKGRESLGFVAPAFLGESRGIVPLDGGEQERGILAAVDEYLLNLRRGDRSQERYYACLLRLLRSPIQFVSDNAQHDLFSFIRSNPAFDTSRILDDVNIPEGIKDCVRFIVIPEREGKSP